MDTIYKILAIKAEPCDCPRVVGGKCDASELRRHKGIVDCSPDKDCPLGSDRELIPLIDLVRTQRDNHPLART